MAKDFRIVHLYVKGKKNKTECEIFRKQHWLLQILQIFKSTIQISLFCFFSEAEEALLINLSEDCE